MTEIINAVRKIAAATAVQRMISRRWDTGGGGESGGEREGIVGRVREKL